MFDVACEAGAKKGNGRRVHDARGNRVGERRLTRKTKEMSTLSYDHDPSHGARARLQVGLCSMANVCTLKHNRSSYKPIKQ